MFCFSFAFELSASFLRSNWNLFWDWCFVQNLLACSDNSMALEGEIFWFYSRICAGFGYLARFEESVQAAVA